METSLGSKSTLVILFLNSILGRVELGENRLEQMLRKRLVDSIECIDATFNCDYGIERWRSFIVAKFDFYQWNAFKRRLKWDQRLRKTRNVARAFEKSPAIKSLRELFANQALDGANAMINHKFLSDPAMHLRKKHFLTKRELAECGSGELTNAFRQNWRFAQWAFLTVHSDFFRASFRLPLRHKTTSRHTHFAGSLKFTFGRVSLIVSTTVLCKNPRSPAEFLTLASYEIFLFLLSPFCLRFFSSTKKIKLWNFSCLFLARAWASRFNFKRRLIKLTVPARLFLRLALDESFFSYFTTKASERARDIQSDKYLDSTQLPKHLLPHSLLALSRFPIFFICCLAQTCKISRNLSSRTYTIIAIKVHMKVRSSRKCKNWHRQHSPYCWLTDSINIAPSNRTWCEIKIHALPRGLHDCVPRWSHAAISMPLRHTKTSEN